MTTFSGYIADPDDLDERVNANALTIATAEGVAADQETAVPLVLVEASYKPGGSCEYPVNLTVLDAIKASSSLVTAAHDSLSETSFATEQAHDNLALLALLKELANLDEAVWELRSWLHAELEEQLKPAKDDEGQDEADAVVFWREAPTSEHRNDGLYPFVFRQDGDGSLVLHSVAGDVAHDHVTSDEPRSFLAASKAYGPLVRCDEHGRPLGAEGQADDANSEAGQ